MNKKLKYFLLLPVVATLASCGGYSLEYIVEGDRYMSANFNKNYYESWNDEFKASFANPIKTYTEATEGLTFIEDFKEVYQLDESTLVNPSAPPTDPAYKELKYSDAEKYGAVYKLNGVDTCFNYGVQSKLFDGISFCRSRYQRVRVQARRNGFSVRLSKESDNLDYFAIQFKATTNNQITCYKVDSTELCTKDQDYFHNSDFDMTISIYCKGNVNDIVCYKFVKHIEFHGNKTNDGSESNYKFLAFNLKNIEGNTTLSRAIGFSVTFDNLQDNLISWNKSKGVSISEDDYALFIYEVFMPHSNWH